MEYGPFEHPDHDEGCLLALLRVAGLAALFYLLILLLN